MKPANVLLFLLLIFVTYIGGFVSGVKKIFPYDIAKQIKEQIEKGTLKGTIVFYGTPAEETIFAKVWMAREGLKNILFQNH